LSIEYTEELDRANERPRASENGFRPWRGFYFDDLEPFHPAQTFTDTTAYYGVRLERDERITRGPNKGTVRRRPVLAIVTSDRKVLEASHDLLRERGLSYGGQDFPEPPEARFRPPSVAKWLCGDLRRPDVAALYSYIRESFSTRVEFSSEAVHDVLALFVCGSYLYRLFDTFPYLVFRGSKAAGKSKTLKIIGALAFNAVEATALTGGALYLEVEAHGATLLLDDAEDLADEEARAVKAMLNVGYKAGGTTMRGNWESQSSRRYSVYCPKAITSVKGVNDTLSSRCITIAMQPSLDPGIKDRGEDPRGAQWPLLRDYLYCWGLSDWQEVRSQYHETSRDAVGASALAGREWELWRPLLALARYFEGQGIEGLVSKVLKLAEETTAEARAEEVDTREGSILTFLLDTHAEGVVEVLPKELSEELENKRGEKISAKSLGWIFRRLNFGRFKSNTATGAVVYNLPRTALVDAAARRGLGVGGLNARNAETSESPAKRAGERVTSSFAGVPEFPELHPPGSQLGREIGSGP
jgi:hypothetical protein